MEEVESIVIAKSLLDQAILVCRMIECVISRALTVESLCSDLNNNNNY